MREHDLEIFYANRMNDIHDSFFDGIMYNIKLKHPEWCLSTRAEDFCCHPAVLIRNEHCSSDCVGTARNCIEAALHDAPTMYVQGFCGDVHPYYLFGTPDQAAALGKRLGEAAVEALATLIPARSDPFVYAWRTAQLPRQAMPSHEMCQQGIAESEAFIEEVLHHNPRATWIGGYNAPDPNLFTPEDRADTA